MEKQLEEAVQAARDQVLSSNLAVRLMEGGVTVCDKDGDVSMSGELQARDCIVRPLTTYHAFADHASKDVELTTGRVCRAALQANLSERDLQTLLSAADCIVKGHRVKKFKKEKVRQAMARHVFVFSSSLVLVFSDLLLSSLFLFLFCFVFSLFFLSHSSCHSFTLNSCCSSVTAAVCSSQLVNQIFGPLVNQQTWCSSSPGGC